MLLTKTSAAAGPAPPINATITAMVVTSLRFQPAPRVAVDPSFPAGAAEGWESDWEEAPLDARGALMAAPWLSALMMLSPDRIAFVKPFFEVFITFSPGRAGRRERSRSRAQTGAAEKSGGEVELRQ